MANRFLPTAILLISVILFLGCTSSPANNTTTNTNTTGNDTQTTTQTPNTPTSAIPVISGTMSVAVSPEVPVAGDDITFTGTLLSQYTPVTWTNENTYSIWIRQFGNWQITECTTFPCSATWETASTGNLEYQVHRKDSTGKEFTDGAYTLTIEPGIKTGDTLGPKVVVFHDPASPSPGGSVTITASVEDVSSLQKVEVWFDGEIVKTCPQKVKISQCIANVTNLVAGAHTYSALAVDTYGNTTHAADQTLDV